MANVAARNAHVLALSASLLLLAAVGLLTWSQSVASREAWLRVHHTDTVIQAVEGLGLALRDAETSQRGYLLTGDETYLVPYRAAQDRVPLLQSEIGRLTADNASQQERLRLLAPLVRDKMDELAQTIGLFRAGGTEAAQAVVQTNRGKLLMEQIRATLAGMAAEEDHLLASRQQTAERMGRWARAVALGGILLAVALLAGSFWLLARSRARLARSEAEQRLLAGQMRTAFDSVSQGIGVFDAGFRLAHWNECFDVLLGVPRPMLRHGTPYEAIAEQAAAAAGAPLLETEDQIRAEGSGHAPDEPVIRERNRASDGRSFEMRRTATPDGGFVLTLSDITERVRAEQTACEAQRMQAMGQLTGGIAHDFNNLLTVVLGNLERLASRLGGDAAAQPQIERAIWATRRGAALTQQLLAFARRQPLAPVPIDLSALLPAMTGLLRRTLGEHIEVQVVADVADAAGLWPALADPAQVESALLNLALNARDAMAPGGGRLTIEVANKVLDPDYARRHTEVTPGDYVMLAVSDTGAGMPPDVAVRAFEPFFTTKETGKGTGLGLAMVHGFAKQSGGHVKIYSEAGHGTTVRLYLPRAAGAALPLPPHPEATTDLPRGSATVLVVEDEVAVREVAAGILRDLGYRVLEASDGAEALRAFGENGARIDLLFTDVVLPGGMKGQEVARRLTEIRPSLRVLFTSGYTENAIVHHGRLDEGVHLISKPFSREGLARKVAEVLAPAAAPPAAGAGNVVDLGARDRGR